jgi:hypothetical protein
MATSITHGLNTIPVDTVLGWTSTREHGNLLHEVIGRSDVEVTFKSAGLRKGTLKLLCLTFENAVQLEQEHAQIGIFTLVNDELPAPGIGMVYVPSGSIQLGQENSRWVLSVEFQEVSS